MKWCDYPNLAKRPHAPNEGRGRLQVQVRRALLVHGPAGHDPSAFRLGLPAQSTAQWLESLEGHADLR
jgi:hypothetical protein